MIYIDDIYENVSAYAMSYAVTYVIVMRGRHGAGTRHEK